MAALFQSVPGRLSVFEIGESVTTFSIDFEEAGLVGFVTTLAVAEEVTVQVATALDTSVHITPFGDKPAQMQVTVILNETCGDEQVVDRFLSGYKRARLAPSNPDAVTVTIGNTAYQAIVVGHTLNAQAGDRTLYSGTLRLLGWAL